MSLKKKHKKRRVLKYLMTQLSHFCKIILFSASFAQAHPVIYEDGFVYWGEFSNGKNTQEVSYTFHPHFAVQISSGFVGMESFESYKYQLGLNVLLKRWLLEGSQANIYTSLRGGFYTSEQVGRFSEDGFETLDLKERLVFQWNLSADWESRKIYTAGGIIIGNNSLTFKEMFGNLDYRIGFAPYVAGMDELQTWFVLMFHLSAVGFFGKEWRSASLENLQEQEDRLGRPDDPTIILMGTSSIHLDWKITPLLRFFYKNVLWEIGSSFQSDFYLTLMVHY